MVTWVIKYLLIGVATGFLLDVLNRNNPDPEQRFNNVDRIVVILVWPIAVGAFVYHFIKSSGGK